MDSLLKVISDKNKEIQQFKKGTYISQREIITKEKEEFLKKHKEKKELKEKLETQKLDELEKRLDLVKKRKLELSSGSEDYPLKITEETTAEIYRRLRKLKLPIIVFAETPSQRYDRLCLSEVGLAGANSSGSNINHDTDSKVNRDFELEVKELSKSTTEDNKISGDALKICNWITKILDYWEQEQSQYGSKSQPLLIDKNVSIITQTRTGLQPLMKLLRKSKLDPSIMSKLCKIIDCIEMADYRGAHDVYLLLAMGNAPWAMGSADISIQARPWKSRIYTPEVGHILNDDTTRKFIQMFKRLMTVAQRIKPTTISKQVLLNTMIT